MRDVGRARGEHRDATLERLGRTQPKLRDARRRGRRSAAGTCRGTGRARRGPVTSTRRVDRDGRDRLHRCRRRARGRDAARQRGERRRRRSRRRRRPPDRRRRGGSRSSARPRAPRSRDGRTQRDGRPPSARRARRRSAASRRAPARGGPPRPIATTTTLRSRAKSRARCAVTAVFPTRLPVPITEIDGSSNGSSCGGSNRKSAPTYESPAASARDAQSNRSTGPEHRLVRQVDDDLGGAEAVDERDAVVGAALAQLLGAADEDRPLPLVRERRECVAHHGRIVLTVDERDGARHRLAVTSLSIRPVYFSYSPVETSNWMIRSCPWNGYRRQTVDMRALDLDHVVTGARVTSEPQRRNGSGVDDEQVLELPRIGNVLVTRQHEMDARPLQALDRIAGVVDDVPLAARARDRQQVVVQDEHLAARRLLELLLDPAVAPAPDLPVVEVGLGRVDRDDGDPVPVHDRAALPDQLLEMHVADVSRVVVSGHDNECIALDRCPDSALPGRTPP